MENREPLNESGLERKTTLKGIWTTSALIFLINAGYCLTMPSQEANNYITCSAIGSLASGLYCSYFLNRKKN